MPATRKPAAPKVAPVVTATPVYSEEMLAVARLTLQDYRNRRQIAHFATEQGHPMNENRVGNIQRSIREKMGLTDTKEACKKLLDHVQQLASPASEATDMVAEAVTKCAKTPEPTADPTKSAEKWMTAIQHAQRQEAQWKENYHEAAAERAQLRSELGEKKEEVVQLQGNITRLENNAREATARAGKFAEELDQLRTTQSELRAILMPAMGIEPENWPAYSLVDAAQGVVELAADRLKDVGDWKSSAEEKHELLQRLSKDLNTSNAEIERLRGTIVERNDRNSALLSERDSHSATAAKIRRRLKAWQTIGILGALVSALLGAGLAYWGIRK